MGGVRRGRGHGGVEPGEGRVVGFLSCRQNKANALESGKASERGEGGFGGRGEPLEDFAGGLKSLQLFEGAGEGAVVLAAVTGEAVDLAGGGFVGPIDKGLGFEALDAAKVPAGGEQLFKERGFEGAGGLDLVPVRGFEIGEGRFFVVADEEAAGEVVPVGVVADGGFAGVGLGAGGVLGVGAVGGLLGSG